MEKIGKIFYGAAIQGEKNRNERLHLHSTLIEVIRNMGYEVIAEHTRGKNKEETAELLEKAIGPLPTAGIERTVYVRRKMIEAIEGDISGAVFEVSTPSTGTGVEIVHAYLRPRKGLYEIPILALYQKDYWPNGLSTMIRGISQEELPNFRLIEYTGLEDAKAHVVDFLKNTKE